LISDGKCFFNLEKMSFWIFMKFFLDIILKDDICTNLTKIEKVNFFSYS